MSNYTQEQQTEIVQDAMNLTAAIILEKSELARLNGEKFKAMPAAPVRKVFQNNTKILPKYPEEPKVNYKFGEFLKELIQQILAKYKLKNRKILIGIGAFIVALIIVLTITYGPILLIGFVSSFLFSFVAIFNLTLIILYFKSYIPKRKQKQNDLLKTPEYLKARENAEKEAELKQNEIEKEIKIAQQKADKEYEEQKEHYEKITIPEYNKEKELWNIMQKQKINVIEEDLKINTETLNTLYDTTKLISKTYREINLLNWLYEDMSSSDHDIRYATELLDRDRQRILTRSTNTAISNMDQNMRRGFNAVYSAIETGNEIQMETLSTLESTQQLIAKTRRDINIGNAVGTVQRHKTNKMLDEMIGKKKR